MSEKTRPGYLEVIVIALLVAAGTVAVYDRMLAQKIRVVDLKGFVRTQKALLKAGQITEDQWKENLDALNRLMDDEAARHPNQVILLKSVVLRSRNDAEIRP
ncbi:hypothetical protein ACLG6S_16600 [Thermodesulfobacteriota bacterium B35]